MKEGMTLGNVDMIIDHDQKVKTLNGRKTSRRASLHFQKTHFTNRKLGCFGDSY